MENRFILGFCLVVASLYSCYGFMNLAPSGIDSTHSFRHFLIDPTTTTATAFAPSSPTQSSSTALGVWFFGGSATEQTTADDESCELVAVRIERPSSNSRKIFGEITVPASLDDVWAVLTDYDRLAVHVPNLVESKIVQRPTTGQQGDGTYRCRLFQRLLETGENVLPTRSAKDCRLRVRSVCDHGHDRKLERYTICFA